MPRYARPIPQGPGRGPAMGRAAHGGGPRDRRLGRRHGPDRRGDLRRAGLDRDDHCAAHRDPAGDQGVSTAPPAREAGTATPQTADAATATMISLIGSLADNKGALGRRYGEWAVSAPTIESAVAA